MPNMNDSPDGQTQHDPQAELLARAVEQLGFQLCEFESDECECCHNTAPLYFQGPTDAGRYMCGPCVADEYQQSEQDFAAMVGILKPASVVPLTNAEIQQAKVLLENDRVCVATLQRKMQIGWNRAADLIEHIKGRAALPAVALRR